MYSARFLVQLSLIVVLVGTFGVTEARTIQNDTTGNIVFDDGSVYNPSLYWPSEDELVPDNNYDLMPYNETSEYDSTYQYGNESDEEFEDQFPSNVTVKSTGCQINVRQHIGEPQPLLIWPGSSNFVRPGNTEGIIRLNGGQTIELFCSRGFRAPLSGNTINAACVSGQQFRWNNQQRNFNQYICNDLSAHTARRTGRRCGPWNAQNTFIAEVGFQVGNRFLRILEACHDDNQGSNLWVRFDQNLDNSVFQSNYPRIGFIQGNFFNGLNVNNLYTGNVQRQTIGRIVNSNQLSWQYVPANSNTFLARGHLAAKADFIYGSQQQATFYFINAAPQWQTFNAGNWMHIENGVRRMVAQRRINTEIYTGTWGVISLRDVNGNMQRIHLAIDGNRRIPVPRIYYKVVIDRANQAGIVFIGVNNPHASWQEVQREYVICDDVANSVNYIPWRRTDLNLGYSYACSVDQFAKRIGELPDLPTVRRLLL